MATVVRVSLQNGAGTVDLLTQYQGSKLVWHRHGTQRQAQIRLCTRILGPATSGKPISIEPSPFAGRWTVRNLMFVAMHRLEPSWQVCHTGVTQRNPRT